MGCVLHQVGAGPRVFTPGGKALSTTDQRQQNRRQYPDSRIRGQHTDQGGGPGHQQNGHCQCAFAANPVAQHAEENPAQRPECKGHGKHREGFEQGCTGIATGEKLLRNGGGQKTVNREIKPLDEVADCGCNNHFSQGFWTDFKGVRTGHREPRHLIANPRIIGAATKMPCSRPVIDIASTDVERFN